MKDLVWIIMLVVMLLVAVMTTIMSQNSEKKAPAVKKQRARNNSKTDPEMISERDISESRSAEPDEWKLWLAMDEQQKDKEPFESALIAAKDESEVNSDVFVLSGSFKRRVGTRMYIRRSGDSFELVSEYCYLNPSDVYSASQIIPNRIINEYSLTGFMVWMDSLKLYCFHNPVNVAIKSRYLKFLDCCGVEPPKWHKIDLFESFKYSDVRQGTPMNVVRSVVSIDLDTGELTEERYTKDLINEKRSAAVFKVSYERLKRMINESDDPDAKKYLGMTEENRELYFD